MKKRITAVILAVIMTLTLAGTIFVNAAEDYSNKRFSSETQKINSMTLAATSKNGTTELYYDDVSGEIAVKNTRTGEILFSNPYDLSTKNISSEAKYQYLSQIIINYTVISSNGMFSYYSYKDSALCDQMTVTKTENGLKVDYELGETKKEIILPNEISKETLDSILEKIEDRYDREDVQNSYVLKSEQNTEYQVYALDGSISELNRRRRAAIVEATGFTLEDMHAEYEKIGYSFNTSDVAKFYITVLYTVNDDGFSATVDASTISYDKSLYCINTIMLLPYLSAAGRTNTGYTFIPDGSGALIRFEDVLAKSSTDNVSGTLYGNDYAYYRVSIKNREQYSLPVFGLVDSTNNKGYFAIIEEGDALAGIVSSHTAVYNSVCANFQLLATDLYDLADSFSSGVTSSNQISVRADDLYQGNCTVRYAMLTSEEAAKTNSVDSYYETSYMGMAKYYRDYLISNGSISKITSEKVSDKTKIFFEVFGSIQTEEKFLTLPITVNKALTTFNDIITMYTEFSEAGIGNMSFILTGFANGGLISQYPTSVKWQKVLGGKAGLNNLLSFADENGIEISPNVDFSYSRGIKTFSGFSYKKNASRTLDNRYTTKRIYNPATQMFMRLGGVVISSASFEYAYEKFYSSISEYQFTSLAPRTLGSDLNSDFDKNDYYDREASKNNVISLLQVLNGQKDKNGYNLIIDKGNAYTLPYASSILNASLDSSRLLTESEAVPFLGIVLHGSVNFTGKAINMEGDEDYMFLKTLENGASLYYTLAMQNVELLKFNSIYNEYYSVEYATWKDKIITMYNTYNSLMSNKQDKYITEHEFMNSKNGFDVKRSEDGQELDNSRVVRVEYENGEGFILNYNSYEITVVYNGQTYTIGRLGYVSYSNN